MRHNLRNNDLPHRRPARRPLRVHAIRRRTRFSARFDQSLAPERSVQGGLPRVRRSAEAQDAGAALPARTVAAADLPSGPRPIELDTVLWPRAGRGRPPPSPTPTRCVGLPRGSDHRQGAVDRLFQGRDQAIPEAGLLPMSGQIVDAPLVATPRQRNTDGENMNSKIDRNLEIHFGVFLPNDEMRAGLGASRSVRGRRRQGRALHGDLWIKRTE